MKKVLVICLMMLMVASVCLSAAAADGGFVTSPSGNPAPTLSSVEVDGKPSDVQLIITPFIDRDELPEAINEQMEKAYTEIKNSDNLTKLNADLEKLAKKNKIEGKNLAVADLFDIRIEGDGNYENTTFVITLDAETLNNFVGLLHMNKDGAWELVKDAKITDDGNLKFSVNSFSPFAIVVNTTPAKPGDNSNIYIYAIILVVSAMALICVAVKIKKQNQRV